MIQILPRWLIAVLLVAGLGRSLRADEMPPLESLYHTAPKGLPSEPAWGYWAAAPKSWIIVHQQLVDRAKRGQIDVVFLGDSITRGWKQAETVNWTDTTPALQAVNDGIGGDSTRQVIWRIRHGVLDGITPRLVVLMIGTNNLYSDQNAGTNEQITEGVKTIIGLIQVKIPGARVLLLGVLPRQTPYWCDRIVILNRLLAGLGEPGRVEFHDAGALFIGTDGRVNTALYNTDLVHLNAAGNELLTATVKPWVKTLLLAPPPAHAGAKAF